ncbi:hypothetical protein GJ496_000388 [Pomphorhynchus laevis]|nr:hypothetical protein GJ496_000388 [Pomphorhynchus laevis]
MDFQHRPGGKTGSGGQASMSESNKDRRERLRQLALEAIDLRKDPYFMKNHLGSYECKLCLTLHNNEGSYLAHTQGKKHQANLARRAAKDAKEAPAQLQPYKPQVEIRKFVKIGRPGYKVTKQRDPHTKQQSLLFQIDYPEIAEGIIPRHRFMSAYEQRVEPPDRRWQYLLFAAEPYETIAFKVPSRELDKDPEKFWTFWNKHTLQFFLQFVYRLDQRMSTTSGSVGFMGSDNQMSNIDRFQKLGSGNPTDINSSIAQMAMNAAVAGNVILTQRPIYPIDTQLTDDIKSAVYSIQSIHEKCPGGQAFSSYISTNNKKQLEAYRLDIIDLKDKLKLQQEVIEEMKSKLNNNDKRSRYQSRLSFSNMTPCVDDKMSSNSQRLQNSYVKLLQGGEITCELILDRLVSIYKWIQHIKNQHLRSTLLQEFQPVQLAADDCIKYVVKIKYLNIKLDSATDGNQQYSEEADDDYELLEQTSHLPNTYAISNNELKRLSNKVKLEASNVVREVYNKLIKTTTRNQLTRSNLIKTINKEKQRKNLDCSTISNADTLRALENFQNAINEAMQSNQEQMANWNSNKTKSSTINENKDSGIFQQRMPSFQNEFRDKLDTLNLNVSRFINKAEELLNGEFVCDEDRTTITNIADAIEGLQPNEIKKAKPEVGQSYELQWIINDIVNQRQNTLNKSDFNRAINEIVSQFKWVRSKLISNDKLVEQLTKEVIDIKKCATRDDPCLALMQRQIPSQPTNAEPILEKLNMADKFNGSGDMHKKYRHSLTPSQQNIKFLWKRQQSLRRLINREVKGNILDKYCYGTKIEMDTALESKGIYRECDRFQKAKTNIAVKLNRPKYEKQSKGKSDHLTNTEPYKRLAALLDFSTPHVDRYLEWDKYFNKANIAECSALEHELICEWTKAIKNLSKHETKKDEPLIFEKLVETKSAIIPSCDCSGICTCPCESCIEIDEYRPPSSLQLVQSSCTCLGICQCSCSSSNDDISDQCMCIGICVCPCSSNSSCNCQPGQCTCRCSSACSCECDDCTCESDVGINCKSESCICLPDSENSTILCTCQSAEECLCESSTEGDEQCICDECDSRDDQATEVSSVNCCSTSEACICHPSKEEEICTCDVEEECKCSCSVTSSPKCPRNTCTRRLQLPSALQRGSNNDNPGFDKGPVAGAVIAANSEQIESVAALHLNPIFPLTHNPNIVPIDAQYPLDLYPGSPCTATVPQIDFTEWHRTFRKLVLGGKLSAAVKLFDSRTGFGQPLGLSSIINGVPVRDIITSKHPDGAQIYSDSTLD